MNHVLIKIPLNDYSFFSRKFNDYNINYSVEKESGNNYVVKINKKDYELIKKIDYKHLITFYKSCGCKHIYELIVSNTEKTIVTLAIVFIVLFSSNLIFKVNINTSDTRLESLIRYSLEDEEIYRFKFVKDYKSIAKIKEKLRRKFSNEIEWIEIDRKGSTYEIYLIKKVKTKSKTHSDKCNYVAKKSGLITSIHVQKGVVLVSENNFIKKNDLLISGQIVYNDELKKEVCASGNITGEVWYKVEVYVPVEKDVKKYENTNKYNFQINLFGKTYKLLKTKYDGEKNQLKIGNENIGLNITKEYKLERNKVKYSSDQLLKIAVNKAHESLLIKLPKNAKIIDEKVLKKNTINGKMYVEVLITTEEELGVVENY